MKITHVTVPLALATLLAGTGSAGATTYEINQTIGSGSIVGSFTTDGTLGTYTDLSHFTSITLSVTAPNITGGTTYSTNWPITGAFPRHEIVATATDLLFDFSVPQNWGFWTTGGSWWCLSGGVGDQGCYVHGESIGYDDSTGEVGQFEDRGNGLYAFASVAAVPLPAGLELLAAGLAGLALLGFAKRRSAVAPAV